MAYLKEFYKIGILLFILTIFTMINFLIENISNNYDKIGDAFITFAIIIVAYYLTYVRIIFAKIVKCIN